LIDWSNRSNRFTNWTSLIGLFFVPWSIEYDFALHN
jgi:hypothetical protein